MIGVYVNACQGTNYVIIKAFVLHAVSLKEQLN